MGINECSKPASKSSWDSQDFGDVNMVLKMVHFRKSSRPQWVNERNFDDPTLGIGDAATRVASRQAHTNG